MSTLRHQSPSFQRRADKAGTRPPRTGRWKFSCPPRLLKPCAATDRTTTAGLAIRDRPRPEGPRTAATAASPLPPTPLARLYKIRIRTAIYCHSFTFLLNDDKITGLEQFYPPKYLVLGIHTHIFSFCATLDIGIRAVVCYSHIFHSVFQGNCNSTSSKFWFVFLGFFCFGFSLINQGTLYSCLNGYIWMFLSTLWFIFLRVSVFMIQICFCLCVSKMSFALKLLFAKSWWLR